MARLWTSGAEANDDLLERVSRSAGTIFQTTTKRSGDRAWECDSGAGNAVAVVTPSSAISGSLGSWFYYRAYFCFEALPASTVKIMRFLTTGGAALASARLTSAGKLQLWNDGGSSQLGSDSAATISADGATWYRVELGVLINSGAVDDSAELRLDGTTVATLSSISIATVAPGNMSMGWIEAPGANKSVFVDDAAVNDDSGSDQNSWPDEGKVVLLLPISDSVRDTLWTGGAGGTTNLFDAVNNTPPTGTASETNTTQIEHAGSAGGTTDDYEANMTTYSTAGLVSGDTVKVVQYVIAHGEDIATGTKLLSMQLLSNPTDTDSGNFSAGGNIGALGTYSTNWSVQRNDVVYDPSVTLGTSPVARVRRPETASRVASVCFMGVWVEYQPAAGGPTTIIPPVATATSAGGTPTMQVFAPTPLSTATGTAPLPTPIARVTPPLATATGTALAPTVIGPSVTIAVPVATATGDGLAPTVRAIVATPLSTATATTATPTVQARASTPVATATGTALTPTDKAVVLVPVATATGASVVPTVRAVVATSLATATGAAPDVTVISTSGQTIVSVPLATATCASVVPTIAAAVTTPLATAAAIAQTPTVRAVIFAPVATATSTAFAPTVPASLPPTATAAGTAQTPTMRAIVAVPVATAIGDALAPSVLSGAGQVVPPTATATGASLVPTVRTIIAVPVATATGASLAPIVPTALPPTATGAGAGLTPVIRVIINVPLATATGAGVAPSPRILIPASVATASGMTIAPTTRFVILPPEATATGSAHPIASRVYVPTATATGFAAAPNIILGVFGGELSAVLVISRTLDGALTVVPLLDADLTTERALSAKLTTT